MPLNVLALPRYDALGASSRMRFLQYLSVLEQAGVQVEVQPLISDAALSARYSTGRYRLGTAGQCFANRVSNLRRRRQFDLLWIEKEPLPWWPQWFESSLLQGVPYVLDIDDAVFHNYDQHQLHLVRRFCARRIDGLMARAALVVGGNDYLARRAKEAGAPWVEVVPTVVDLARYTDTSCTIHTADRLPRIVWIGSPSTVRYLELIREPLQALALRVPFVLRVMGANVEWPGMNVECVRWTEATEVTFIAEGSVGVMPLLDTPWERGKCGYKLIQYMACGVPVVASPVGVNPEIVQDGCHGFLATTTEEWVVALERLLTDPRLCSDMGREGRKRVESKYCLQVTGPRMVELLKRAAQGT